MGQRIEGACRGDGEFFVGLRIGHDIQAPDLYAHAIDAAGNRFPVAVYRDPTDHSLIVLVVPWLDTSLKIVLEASSGNGSRPTILFSRKFISAFLVWRCRFDRRTKQDLCERMTRLNSLSPVERPSLCVTEGFSTDEGWFVSGWVENRLAKDASFRARTFTAATLPITVGRRQRNARLPQGAIIEEFSVHVREKARDIILSIERTDGEPRDVSPRSDGSLLLSGAILASLQTQHYERCVNAYDDPAYPAWFAEHARTGDELASQRKEPHETGSLFSIIVPLFRTPLSFLNDMARSVLDQTYGNFELVLVNASPEDGNLACAVQDITDSDRRVKTVTLKENLGITENTNAGIKAANGDFLCFLDHDDILTPDALYEYARALHEQPDIDLLYCDEDMLENGVFCKPLFKPDFSPDLLRSKNYVIHFLAIRHTLFDAMPCPTDQFDGAQDYNATLFAAEQARRICHVSRVLYHWRVHEKSTAIDASAKPYAEEAGRLSLQNHLDRVSPGAIARTTDVANIYRISYPLVGNPLVSIIGGVSPLCLSYQNVEHIPLEQNDAASLNIAVAAARGDYVFFAGAGHRFDQKDGLESLLGICQREDVGAVGSLILFSDGYVKQSGYAVTEVGVLPLHHSLHYREAGYLFQAKVTQNVSATSTIGMMTSRALFKELGGFEEADDIDPGVGYCRKVREKQLLVVQEPHSSLTDLNKTLQDSENEGIHPLAEMDPDPYFNINLDQSSPFYRLPAMPQRSN